MNWISRLLGREPAEDAASVGRLVVVDTETSGLDPERDDLLAIGAVAIDGEGVAPEDSFEVVLRNEAKRDASNVIVHGIGLQAQARGTPPEVALTAYRDYVGRSRCIGFHTDFDRKVLRRAFAAHGIDFDERPWLDLAPLAGALHPDSYRSGGRSLDDWLAAFNIGVAARHNAAGDALATAELFLRLRADAARQGSREFKALLAAARQQKWLGAD